MPFLHYLLSWHVELCWMFINCVQGWKQITLKAAVNIDHDLQHLSIDLSTNRVKYTFCYIVRGIKVALPGPEKGTFMLSISHLLFSVRTGGLSGGAAEMGTMTTGLPDPVGDIPRSANTALAFHWASVPFLKNKEKLCVIKIMSWMKIWCRYWNKLCLLY